MQNSLIEKDLAYVGIREDAGKKRYLRPLQFAFNAGVPTVMDMEGCTAIMDYLAHNSVDRFMKSAFSPA